MPRTTTEVDLAFLDAFTQSESTYRQPSWLKSDFSAPIWRCEAEGLPEIIDFNIALDDGQILTSPTQSKLKDALGCILTVQLHPDATFRRLLAPTSASARLAASTRIVDWFLMNGKDLHLAKHGLEAITVGDVRRLIRDLATSSKSTESIYRWRDTLEQYLRAGISSADQKAINNAIESTSGLDTLDPNTPRTLRFSDTELIQARGFLALNQLYRSSNRYDSFKHRPDTGKLSRALYRHTLFGVTAPKPAPPELCFGNKMRSFRERPAVPVQQHRDEISGPSHDYYKRVLRTFPILSRARVALSPALERCTEEFSYFSQQPRVPLGRFKSLPVSNALSALRSSIEFFLKYADSIVDSYLNGKALAEAEGAKHMDLLPPEKYVHAQLQAIGTSAWSIEYGANKNARGRPDYFNRLRANHGLRELILVLIGSTQVTIGILTARRQSELAGLTVGTALHPGGRHLVFANGKSGALGIRQSIARPIQAIAVRMIRTLERLHSTAGIVDAGCPSARLFSAPDGSGLAFTAPTMNICFDAFCDYFEAGTDAEGRRYYIRQHQLRRFFAMMFFWSHSFGGLDTIRWFLGHTDPEHVYHYISAALTDSELAAVKAEYAIARMNDSDPESPLRHFLHERLGASSVSLMSNEELLEYVEMCIADGLIIVEPEYFQDSSGKHYRILVLIKDGDRT